MRTTDLAENRPDFFNQDLAETLPDVAAWLDATAVVIHPRALTDEQVASLRTFMEQRLNVAPRIVDGALLYDLRALATTAPDGVFLYRAGSDGWQNVRFDREQQSIFANITDRAQVTLVNTKDMPVRIELSFTLSTGSTEALSVTKNGRSLLKVEQVGDGRFRVITEILPGQTEVEFVNGKDENMTLQNPSLTTMPLSVQSR